MNIQGMGMERGLLDVRLVEYSKRGSDMVTSHTQPLSAVMARQCKCYAFCMRRLSSFNNTTSIVSSHAPAAVLVDRHVVWTTHNDILALVWVFSSDPVCESNEGGSVSGECSHYG